MLVYPLLDFLCLSSFGAPIEISGRNLLEVGILASSSANQYQRQQTSGAYLSAKFIQSVFFQDPLADNSCDAACHVVELVCGRILLWFSTSEDQLRKNGVEFGAL